MLVAEVLLQRSRGKTVASVYEGLFSRWPDAASLSRARETSIVLLIRPLGLIRGTSDPSDGARRSIRLGGVPADLDALLALPGVGRYAANATLVVAFGKRAPVVDGVSARVYRRYLGLPSDLPLHRTLPLARGCEGNPAEGIKGVELGGPRPRCRGLPPGEPRCDACPLVARCAFAAAA